VSVPAPTRELVLPDELKADDAALRAVVDWIESFVAEPNESLGRPGPVCPFVPGSLERRTLWLASESIADRSDDQVVELMERYKRLFLETQPVDGADAVYKVIVVVFPDLPAARAQEVFGAVLERLALPSYEEDGILFGPFYEGNEGTAIYNAGFRPFQSPVPFLFVRSGVVTDWKFFLDDEQWLHLWSRRFGEAAVDALAAEVRRLPWRTAAGQGG
jgi:hypothetical protein